VDHHADHDRDQRVHVHLLLGDLLVSHVPARSITIVLGVASIPFLLSTEQTSTMLVGAAMMGFFGMGVWGMAPAYTSERYPTEVRGAGPDSATTRAQPSVR
jgi:MFS family permease